jgi:cell division protein FtsL
MNEPANATRRARLAPAPGAIRSSSRPSAARAAAAARLAAKPAGRQWPFDPRRVGEGVRHLRVVEPRQLTMAERRRRTRLLLEGGVAVAVVVVFGLVYLHVVLAQRQFALDHMTAQVQQEQARYQSLRLEVAQIGSPQNIIATAEGQLGMVQPASVTYLTPAHEIGAPASTSASKGTGTAPAGDANWPQIKSQLAGSP